MSYNSRKYNGRYPQPQAAPRSTRIDWAPIILTLVVIALFASAFIGIFN